MFLRQDGREGGREGGRGDESTQLWLAVGQWGVWSPQLGPGGEPALLSVVAVAGQVDLGPD